MRLAGVVVVGLVWLVVAGCGSNGGDHGDEVAPTAASGPDSVVSSPDATKVPDEPGGPGIAGRVTSAGDPVAGALLSPASLDTPPQAVIEIAVLTDRDGRYRWSLGPGAWEMTASADGFRSLTKRVDVRAGELSTLDFELERG